MNSLKDGLHSTLKALKMGKHLKVGKVCRAHISHAQWIPPIAADSSPRDLPIPLEPRKIGLSPRLRGIARSPGVSFLDVVFAYAITLKKNTTCLDRELHGHYNSGSE